MNLDAIKKRLDSLSKPSGGGNNNGEKKNLFWKPTIGKQTIRVVPSKFNKEMPFTEMLFYYSIGKFNTMASPSNWGEKDPIAEFAKQLRQTNDKDNWRLAKKLDPKVRTFIPVIVRGEESEGVKLWQFGKETYQDFLNMAADEEVGDYTDVLEGRDVKLTTVGPEVTGTKYNKTNISPSLKSSPLSNDKDQVNSFLEDQVDPMKVFKRYSFDEIKESLQEWLEPEDEDGKEDETASESKAVETSKERPKSNYSLDVKTAKKTKADKFDDLFNAENETEDDLPF